MSTTDSIGSIADITMRRTIEMFAERCREELPTLDDLPERGGKEWCDGYQMAMADAANAISDLERRVMKMIPK